MNDFLQLLASLDIGKASFLAFTLLVIWREQEAVRVLRKIERHVAESKYLIQETRTLIHQNTRALEIFAGVLRRRGIEVRKEELTHDA